MFSNRKKYVIIFFICLIPNLYSSERLAIKISAPPKADLPQEYAKTFSKKHEGEISISSAKHVRLHIDILAHPQNRYLRLSIMIKGTSEGLSCFGIQRFFENNRKHELWTTRYNIGKYWRKLYFYSTPDIVKNKRFAWQIELHGKGKFIIKNIRAEVLSPSDLQKNLVPPNLKYFPSWISKWGKEEMKPRIVSITESPFGREAISAFEQWHHKHLSTIDLPLVPGGKFVFEFWAKSDEEGGINCQAVIGKKSVKRVSISLRKEWRKYKYTFVIPSDIDMNKKFWIMFFKYGSEVEKHPTRLFRYYIADFKCHYVKTKK